MTEIKTQVTKLEDDKVKLQAEIPAEEVQAQVDHTLKHLAKDVKMPGFRAGKIPRAVLVSRLGKEAILSQTLQDALPKWYGEAVTASGIKPIDQPEMEDVQPLEGQDQAYSFEATVQVQPRVTLGKYTGLEVDKEVAEIADAEIEDQVDRLRKRFSSLQPVEDRAAQKGDFVVIDFEGSVDGAPLEGGAGKDYMLELGSGQFIPGFEDQIAGMEKGQSKKLTLTFPEDYQPENLAGKDVEFDVVMKDVKERVLPDASDEFAADASEFDTIAELRGDIRKRMQDARETAAANLVREQVVEKAAAIGEVEVPPVMVDSRIKEIKAEFMMALQQSGMTYENYLQQVGVPEEEIEKNFRDQAERLVKEDLVLEAIAENEGLAISDEELEEEIRYRAAATNSDPEELIKQMRKSGRAELIRENLLKRKAVDYLVEKAIPILKKAEGAEEAGKIITP